MLAEESHQLGRGLIHGAAHKNVVSQLFGFPSLGSADSARRLSIPRTDKLNAAFTRLARAAPPCQGAGMSRPPRSTPMAGGFLITAGVVLGTFLGTRQGETSLGIMIGMVAGLLLALLIWLWDRRRA
jgi:hypothetical protein